METKICSKCDNEKELNEFPKDKYEKSGYKYICKKCSNDRSKKYHEKNKENIKARKRKNYWSNRKIKIEKVKKYRFENSDKLRKYRKDNKEKRNNNYKKYYKENNQNILNKNKEYYIKNKSKIDSYNRKRRKERYDTDPIYKITVLCRGRMKKFLNTKNITKKNRTFEIIGCTPKELKIYIENQFTEGMTWENYGFYGWHVDHRIPLDSGKTEEEIYKLCHHSNLQPLWWKDNLDKSNKLPNLILDTVPMVIS